MLKQIPAILSPELMKVMLEMGHGDELVIADGNFPAASIAQRLVRADGHGVPPLLDAILRFFPLDSFVAQPVALMGVGDGSSAHPPIWSEYESIIRHHEPAFVDWEQMERMAFYQRSQRAYAVVATGEQALYANIILKKGVVTDEPPPGASPTE